MFLVSYCICLCPVYWSHVLSWEWRCSWSSADNYIWVINNLIAHKGAPYIRDLTVIMPPDTRVNFCCLHTSVRGVQLFRWIRLQGDGKVLQGVGASRRMGLFWWIQQDWIRGEWNYCIYIQFTRLSLFWFTYISSYYLVTIVIVINIKSLYILADCIDKASGEK